MSEIDTWFFVFGIQVSTLVSSAQMFFETGICLSMKLYSRDLYLLGFSAIDGSLDLILELDLAINS